MEKNALIYSSNAIFNITSALMDSEVPLSFREITRRAKTGIRSAQLAIKKLSQNGFISRKNFKNRTMYKLNHRPELEELKIISNHRKNKILDSKAAHYSKNSLAVLNSMSDLTNFALNTRNLNPK